MSNHIKIYPLSSIQTKNLSRVRLNNDLKNKILLQYYKTDINKITERAVMDKMNMYGSALIIVKLRNISAVSFTCGNGIFSGTSTLRNSHRGSQPS